MLEKREWKWQKHKDRYGYIAFILNTLEEDVVMVHNNVEEDESWHIQIEMEHHFAEFCLEAEFPCSLKRAQEFAINEYKHLIEKAEMLKNERET